MRAADELIERHGPEETARSPACPTGMRSFGRMIAQLRVEPHGARLLLRGDGTRSPRPLGLGPG